nr:angiopoietin-related protein 7 [Ciona intestinalis]|eukprot:XP_002121464.3 angiopoietin-related protein 7 [Ciona intestinalis]
MKLFLCISVLGTMLALCKETFAVSSDDAFNILRERRKPRTKPACPDGCKLKRKINKFETALQNRLASIEDACLPNNISSRIGNQSIDIGPYMAEMQRNISAGVQSDVDQIVLELKETITDNLATVQTSVNEMNTVLRTIPSTLVRFTTDLIQPPTEDTVASGPSSLDLTIMNATLRRLTHQNKILLRKAKAATDLSTVIREQNLILSGQNRELRLQTQSLNQRTRTLQTRLDDLEAVVALHNRSLEGDRESVTSDSDITALSERVNDVTNDVTSIGTRLNRVENWVADGESDGGRPLPPIPVALHPQPDVPPNDCQELYNLGYTESGVYRIHPWQSRETFEVFCEQNYYGGGWTVIQRRRDGSVDFNRDWNDYALGFGEPSGEYWLGNENIHQLTNQNTFRLHIVLLDWAGNRAYAEYEGFRVSSSRDYYSVRFGGYSGTAGDALRGNPEDGSRNAYLARFGARDLDNDSCRPCMYEGQAFESCAERHSAGWWYRACTDSNLNGRYITSDNFGRCNGADCLGIQWNTWHDEGYSLKATMMMVKSAAVLPSS